jgi:methionyl-tRNA formyltransferase
MRIALFSSDETIFLLPMWEQLLPKLQACYDVRGLWVFPDVMGKYQGLDVPLWYLKTFGFGTTLQLAIRRLKSTLTSRARFRQLCQRHDMPLLRGDNPNAQEVVKWLQNEQIDILLISVGFILKAETIRTVRLGVLNRHSSLLPAYRGLHAVFWTLLEGRVPLGLTIHRIDERVDCGEILVQRAFPEFKGSVFDAYALLTQAAAPMFLQAIEALTQRTERVVISDRDHCYRSLPTRDQAREFAERGLRLV